MSNTYEMQDVNASKNVYPQLPPAYEATGQSASYPPPQPAAQNVPQLQTHYVPQPPPVQIHVPPMVIEPQATILIAPVVGREPTMINCPACRNTVVTRVDYQTTTRTHLCAALCCLFCLCPCALIPYCTATCRKINHYCPSCGSYIATYHK